jgi:hypothetical protein
MKNRFSIKLKNINSMRMQIATVPRILQFVDGSFFIGTAVYIESVRILIACYHNENKVILPYRNSKSREIA